MIRLLIADDEPVALSRLELALQCLPEVDLVAKAANGPGALDLIRRTSPDVVLLDIQMPGRNGFDVISALAPAVRVPEFIFVTAHEEHAIRAFELNAVDYLLKPVPFERLREAIARATTRLESRRAEARLAELHDLMRDLARPGEDAPARAFQSDIWVKQGDGLARIDVESVDLFEAAGDYVLAHVGDTTHLLNESLSALQARLDPAKLLRVHRSSIVNIKRVRGLRRRGRRGLTALLNTGRQVAIGPTFADQVLVAVKARRWR